MMNSEKYVPLIETERTNIYITHPDMAETVLNYKIKNKAFLKIHEIQREANYYTIEDTLDRIQTMYQDLQDKKCLPLIVTSKENQQIIASINFTNFVYGAIQACNLGYSLDQDYEGRGFMSEIAKASIDYVKNHYEIHRIMASHIIDNQRSANLLAKMGFEKIGIVRAYVKMNGKWQDAMLNALIFDRE